VGREVQDGVNSVCAEHLHYEIAITDFSNDERGIEHRLPEPGGQIVQDDDLLCASSQLQNGVASDVSGAAGD
jgi:hypothetical protein